jgi:hypothetical protein
MATPEHPRPREPAPAAGGGAHRVASRPKSASGALPTVIAIARRRPAIPRLVESTLRLEIPATPRFVESSLRLEIPATPRFVDSTLRLETPATPRFVESTLRLETPATPRFVESSLTLTVG